MKTNKILIIVASIVILLLAGVICGGAMYMKQQGEGGIYFTNTTVNGYDMSGMTPQQALDQIASDYSSATVQLMEDGKEAIGGQLADFGYVIDQEKLLASLKASMEKQRKGFMDLVGSLMNGSNFTVPIPFTFYEETLNAAVSAEKLPEERVSSVDAVMEYDKKKNEYSIRPETYGNEFADSDLRSYVRGKIDSFVSENNPGSHLTIDFPEDIYIKPQITQGDVELNTRVNIYNSLCKAKVTYVFGKEKESIDWNTIQDWVTIENGEGIISDEKAYEYVISIASKYNTRHYDRTFHTSLGYDVIIPSSENDYGYTINEDEEFRQLIADIRSNSKVEREPIYYTTNSEYGNPLFYSRNGTDDLNGTYVEVNLTAQHLWFYKDGSLLVDTDIVSGCVAKKSETKTGTFPVAYKESPSVLVGADAANGYRTEVKYWMPFYDGQGLHDADWRYSFGGNIYQTSGSHGCVNMPPAAAETMYYNIDAGVAVIIYK